MIKMFKMCFILGKNFSSVHWYIYHNMMGLIMWDYPFKGTAQQKLCKGGQIIYDSKVILMGYWRLAEQFSVFSLKGYFTI